MSGFYEGVEAYTDDESFVEVEVTERHRVVYGADGDIRVQIRNGSGGRSMVWLNRKDSKRLRKALKRAEKFLENS